MKRTLFGILPLLLLLTGCLEFEEQTLTYSYDAKADTLRIFQDYHGIFGGDSKGELSNDELDQLKSVLTTQRTFFFCNWIFELNLPLFREELDKLKTSEGRKESKLSDANAAKAEQLLNLLLENVRVENGDFYLDAKGRLCGVQKVTLTRVSKIIAAGNACFPVFLKGEAENDGVSAEEKALYLKSAARGGEFVRLEGDRLSFRFPLLRAEYEKSFAPGSTDAKQLAEFKRCGGRVSFADDELALSIGSPAETQTTLTLSFSGEEKPYEPNAIAAVKKQAAIREKFDPQAAAKEFLGQAGSSGGKGK
ncbi:MAG: hypothetical protein HY300_20425 [Verrucomicrobia bacterium]|nr:hypothetical protein [Verrucomicrobiota bacterium]